MGFYNEKRATDPKWTAGDEEHDRALAECGVAVEAASRIRPQPTRWLVQNIVPLETVTIVAGAAGAGKTFFACQLAADTARQLGGRVVLATSGPEGPELLRWRLDQADGDPRRIAIATLAPIDFNDQRKKPAADEIDERLSILYHTIEAAGDTQSGILPAEINPDRDAEQATPNDRQDPVRLLVIDDADGWFGKPGNMLSAAKLARVVERLNELARSKHLAIVMTVRAQLSVEGRMTARQFSRLAHAASVVWMVVKEGAAERRPDEPGNAKPRRWLLPLKNNLAEDGTAGLTFELAEGKIRWLNEPAPELAEALLPNAGRNDRRRLRLAACEWLKEALAAGPMPSAEVIKQGVACGFSRGTLQRALDDLGVRSRKTGLNGGWEMHWTPPPESTESTPAAGGGLRVVGAEECAVSCAPSEKHEELESASRAPSEEHEELESASCASWEKHEPDGGEVAGHAQRRAAPRAARAAC